MSYTCPVHGWRHLLNPCPSCMTYSSATNHAELTQPKVNACGCKISGPNAHGYICPHGNNIQPKVDAEGELQAAFDKAAKDHHETTQAFGAPLGGIVKSLDVYKDLVASLSMERDKYKAALEKISLASEAFNDWFEEARYYRKVAREALNEMGET